jgi:hypothetical protein
MTVEDHPLFPQWKSTLERLIQAKYQFELAKTLTERSTCAFHYGIALDAYYQIADDI